MKQKAEKKGWAILTRLTTRHKWRIGYQAIFSDLEAARKFANTYEMGGDVKIVRAVISATF